MKKSITLRTGDRFEMYTSRVYVDVSKKLDKVTVTRTWTQIDNGKDHILGTTSEDVDWRTVKYNKSKGFRFRSPSQCEGNEYAQTVDVKVKDGFNLKQLKQLGIEVRIQD